MTHSNPQPISALNAEALQSLLNRRLTMRERFRLPFSKEDAITALAMAVKTEVEFRQRQFVVTDELKNQLAQMADFLTSGCSKFGILLCGTCGNGKSTLVKAFQSLLNTLNLRNELRKENWGIRIITAREIANLCKIDFKAWHNLTRDPMLGIDDLGTEPLEVLDYGNVLNPVVDLLMKRYDEQLFTLITTNLRPQEIREKYGERMADRFNEMMEKIIYKNVSYRLAQS